MNRWHATTEPQHMLPVVADHASGTLHSNSARQNSKPAPREAPPSA